MFFICSISFNALSFRCYIIYCTIFFILVIANKFFAAQTSSYRRAHPMLFSSAISFLHCTIEERKVLFRFPFTLKYKKLMIRFVNVVLTKHNFSNTIIGITNESCPVTFVRTREKVGARTPTNLDTFCSRTILVTEVEHSHNFSSSGQIPHASSIKHLNKASMHSETRLDLIFTYSRT